MYDRRPMVTCSPAHALQWTYVNAQLHVTQKYQGAFCFLFVLNQRNNIQPSRNQIFSMVSRFNPVTTPRLPLEHRRKAYIWPTNANGTARDPTAGGLQLWRPPGHTVDKHWALFGRMFVMDCTQPNSAQTLSDWSLSVCPNVCSGDPDCTSALDVLPSNEGNSKLRRCFELGLTCAKGIAISATKNSKSFEQLVDLVREYPPDFPYKQCEYIYIDITQQFQWRSELPGSQLCYGGLSRTKYGTNTERPVTQY